MDRVYTMNLAKKTVPGNPSKTLVKQRIPAETAWPKKRSNTVDPETLSTLSKMILSHHWTLSHGGFSISGYVYCRKVNLQNHWENKVPPLETLHGTTCRVGERLGKTRLRGNPYKTNGKRTSRRHGWCELHLTKSQQRFN